LYDSLINIPLSEKLEIIQEIEKNISEKKKSISFD
jgi:hypothetical protein